MRKLRSAFVTGLLVLVPLMATVDILRWFIKSIDNSFRNYLPQSILPIDFPGIGLFIALIIILITGVLTQNYVGQWLVNAFDLAIRKITVVGSIYGVIKKFLETILNPSNDKFSGVVLIQFPREGVYSIGFRTGKPDSHIVKDNPKNLVNVFVPCTPNPTSGFYLLVPEKDLTPLSISVQDAFKTVVSMGIVSSDSAEDISHAIQKQTI